jgi:hypothetical protein
MHSRTWDVATVIAASLVISTGCGGDKSTTQPEPDGPPTVTLSISASTGFVGQQVILTWSSTNAISCAASGAWSGSQQTNGSQSVTVNTAGAQTYSLACTGAGGSANASATFTATTPALSLTHTFSPNNLTISTSEGAPYGDGSLWLGRTSLGSRLGYGPSKVQRLYICLSGQVDHNNCSQAPRVTGPLSNQMLAGIEAGIAAYEGTGARVIVRFIYKWDESQGIIPNPPLSLMLTHVDQLAPILLRHRDIIMALQSGFIGNWGQWVDKVPGIDTSRVAQKQLLDKQLSHFKGVFPVLLPWVGSLIRYAGSRAVIVDGLGLHDDDFDSGVGAAQPFFNRDRPDFNSMEPYAAQVSAASLFVGETSNLYPTQSCAILDSVAYQFHIQSIGLNDNPPGIWAALQNNGCGLSFLNKVGTRIELQSATMLGDPTAGGSLVVALTMLNAGYGRVIRARPATLVLASNGIVIAELPISLDELDLRQLAARAGPKILQFPVTLPSSLPSGSSISLSLRIPDPAPSLTRQAAYALPLNSNDRNGRAIFDPTTGLNMLGSFTSR